MRKIFLVAVLFGFCLSGCINFNPNKSKDTEEKLMMKQKSWTTPKVTLQWKVAIT